MLHRSDEVVVELFVQKCVESESGGNVRRDAEGTRGREKYLEKR